MRAAQVTTNLPHTQPLGQVAAAAAATLTTVRHPHPMQQHTLPGVPARTPVTNTHTRTGRAAALGQGARNTRHLNLSCPEEW